MTTAIWGAIGIILTVIVGVLAYFGRKAAFRRQQADKAKEDLNNANKNDDPSSLLDAFGRMRR